MNQSNSHWVEESDGCKDNYPTMLCFPTVTSVAVAEEERAIKQSGLNRRLKKCRG